MQRLKTLLLSMVALGSLGHAAAQGLVSYQISVNLTGLGSGDLTTGFGLTGQGTMSPFGNVSLVIVGSSGSISAIPVTFTFTFSGGDTLVATSSAQGAPDEVSGTAFVSGGTGQFQAATGSFGFTLIAPPDTVSTNVMYTMAASGTIMAAGQGLQLSPASLSFNAMAGGNSPASQTVTVLSQGAAQAAFSVALDGGQVTTPAPSWLTVTPPAGTTPAVLVVNVNPVSLSPGTFTARIVANGTAVGVTLTVASAPPQLAVSPGFLRFSASAPNPGFQDQLIAVSNAGGAGALNFSVSTPVSIPWVAAIAPSSGQASPNNPVSVDVRIDTSGLAAGGYKGTIRFSSANTTIDVPISLFVTPGGAVLNVDQTGMRFDMQQGQPSGPSDTIMVLDSGDPGSTVNYTASIVNNAPWLAIAPTSGTATPGQPGTLQLSVVNTQNLAAGGYYGLLQIADSSSHNSPQFVVVVLNVSKANSPVPPNPTPQGLVFTGAGTQPLAVQVSGATIPFAAAAVTSDGGSWLSLSPASGSVSTTSPATVSVIANPAGLKAGVYTGLVNVATGAQVRGVNVTLIVPASSGAAARPKPQATCTPTRVVMTQTALTTNFSVPAGWPTDLQIAMYDDCANLLNSGSVSASFSNGDPPVSLHFTSPGLFSATWQPANSRSGMTINERGSSGTLQAATVQISGGVTPNTAPVLYPNGTINNYYAASALSPGLIAQVYGTGLAAGPGQPDSLPLPGTFQGTSVMIGNEMAPLYYVSGGQINVQLPTDLPTGQQVILVSANGAFTLPDLLDINPWQPGIAAYADGSNNAIAQHADFSYVTAASPAKPGEVVIIYLAGMGATKPAVQSGHGAPTMEPLARVVNQPVVTVDGQQAAVEFAGLAPGFAGLYQIDFQIPASARTGSLPLVISQSGVAGNTTNLIVSQ